MNVDILKQRAEAYHKRFEAELSGVYERLTDFKGSHELLSARHIPCGQVRTAAARDFFRKGCPICDRLAARQRRADRQSQKNVKQIEEQYGVTAKSEYAGMREPMLWECNICGAVMSKTVENILWRNDGWGGGVECDCKITAPNDVVSAGAFQVIQFLRARKIPYMREVRFDTCCMTRPLPFDFIVYDCNGSPRRAIEYNGQQHYMPFEMFGGEERLQQQQAADKLKAEWCEAHGIELITIKYDEDVDARLTSVFG